MSINDFAEMTILLCLICFSINAKIQPACKNRHKNAIFEECQITVCKINAFLRFTQKFKTAAKNGWKTTVNKKCKMTAYTLGAKNFTETALAHNVPGIKMFLCFRQIFKIADKNGRKMSFGKITAHIL